MRTSLPKALFVFLLLTGCHQLLGCNQPDGAPDPRDLPQSTAASDGSTVPAANHQKLQMEVQTALTEIKHETERIQVETRTKDGAMTKAHLDNIASLKARIAHLKKELARAEKTETPDFRRFRMQVEGQLADWGSEILALEQTVMWAGAGQPVD